MSNETIQFVDYDTPYVFTEKPAAKSSTSVAVTSVCQKCGHKLDGKIGGNGRCLSVQMPQRKSMKTISHTFKDPIQVGSVISIAPDSKAASVSDSAGNTYFYDEQLGEWSAKAIGGGHLSVTVSFEDDVEHEVRFRQWGTHVGDTTEDGPVTWVCIGPALADRD